MSKYSCRCCIERRNNAWKVCEQFDVRPADWPAGDAHHCELPFSERDKEFGSAIAYFLGTLWSDVSPEYFCSQRTSVDEWARVARALRIHGLKIVNDPAYEDER